MTVGNIPPETNGAPMTIFPRERRVSLAAAAAITFAISLGLSGCSLSASTGTATIAGADLAKQVADQFEKQVNVRPVVDCGTADIQIVEGATVHCDFSASDAPSWQY